SIRARPRSVGRALRVCSGSGTVGRGGLGIAGSGRVVGRVLAVTNPVRGPAQQHGEMVGGSTHAMDWRSLLRALSAATAPGAAGARRLALTADPDVVITRRQRRAADSR